MSVGARMVACVPPTREEGESMADKQRTIPLHQLASIVIDAYLSRDEAFVPVFGEKYDEVCYLAHDDAVDSAEGDPTKKRPKLNFWYMRSDY